MSFVYEIIKNLNFTIKEKNDLCFFFTNNPEKKTEAESILSTCKGERMAPYLKSLLKPGMFSLSCVSLFALFANNTEYLLILVLFLPASYHQTRPKKIHLHYRRTTCW